MGSLPQGLFYGTIVKPGKATVFSPPPEPWALHLSQAALPVSAKEGTRTSLKLQLGPDEEPVVLCTLTAGRLDTIALDQFLTQYAEFVIEGPSPIHLTGYYTPEPPMPGDSEDEDEGDEDEEGEEADPRARALALMNGALRGGDSDSDEGEEEDEDDEDEDGDDEDDEAMLDGFGEGEDDEDFDSEEDEEADEGADEESDEDGDDDMPMFAFPGASRNKPSVVIEEIHDKEEKKPAAQKGDKQQSDKPAKDVKVEAKEAQHATPAGSKRPAEATPVQQQQQAAKKQAQTPQPKAEPKPESKPAPKSEPKPAAKPKVEAKAEAKPAPQAASKQEPPSATKSEKADKASKIRKYANGFEVENIKQGPASGKIAKPGKKVTVHYVGKLKQNGKVFDKTSGNKGFSFRLGVGEVIKGWDMGVEDMRVGDKRKLTIPPQLAYGSSGVKGAIPPNATLEFDVELLDVK